MDQNIAEIEHEPSVCVFMPSPILTITIEHMGEELDAHHIHAGGQGFWVARMIGQLGIEVCLAAPFGGDTGPLLRHLIEIEGVNFCGVDVQEPNGSYIHDRREGQRVVLSEVASGRLSRHELDDFYNATLVAALDASVLVLTGPAPADIVPSSTYMRIARDARANDVPVVADLSGEALHAALEGGVDVLKVSHQEVIALGIISECNASTLVEAARELHAAGADNVIISRAGSPAIALIEEEIWEVRVPDIEPLEHRGAGDSMTAGITVGLARGYSMIEAVRLGAGAGTLNVTRHGLGTGRRDHIKSISRHVEFRPLNAANPSDD